MRIPQKFPKILFLSNINLIRFDKSHVYGFAFAWTVLKRPSCRILISDLLCPLPRKLRFRLSNLMTQQLQDWWCRRSILMLSSYSSNLFLSPVIVILLLSHLLYLPRFLIAVFNKFCFILYSFFWNSGTAVVCCYLKAATRSPTSLISCAEIQI